MQILLNEALGAFLGTGLAWAIFLGIMRREFEGRLDNITARLERLERK